MVSSSWTSSFLPFFDRPKREPLTAVLLARFEERPPLFFLSGVTDYFEFGLFTADGFGDFDNGGDFYSLFGDFNGGGDFSSSYLIFAFASILEGRAVSFSGEFFVSS